jgi:hypothetical protein
MEAYVLFVINLVMLLVLAWFALRPSISFIAEEKHATLKAFVGVPLSVVSSLMLDYSTRSVRRTPLRKPLASARVSALVRACVPVLHSDCNSWRGTCGYRSACAVET